MKLGIITTICWLYYVALIYTAFNPSHDYVSFLENANVFYLIIHTPLNILMGLIALVAIFSKEEVIKRIKEQLEGASPEKLNKLIETGEKLKTLKWKLFYLSNRLLTVGAMMVSFIIYGYFGLGVVMLVGLVSGLVVTDFISEVYKKAKNNV